MNKIVPLKAWTFGSIVASLNPVSKLLKTAVTSSSSLSVNISGLLTIFQNIFDPPAGRSDLIIGMISRKIDATFNTDCFTPRNIQCMLYILINLIDYQVFGHLIWVIYRQKDETTKTKKERVWFLDIRLFCTLTTILLHLPLYQFHWPVQIYAGTAKPDEPHWEMTIVIFLGELRDGQQQRRIQTACYK